MSLAEFEERLTNPEHPMLSYLHRKPLKSCTVQRKPFIAYGMHAVFVCKITTLEKVKHNYMIAERVTKKKKSSIMCLS